MVSSLLWSLHSTLTRAERMLSFMLLFAAFQAITPAEVIIEANHYFFISGRFLFLYVLLVWLQVKASFVISSLFRHALINQRSHFPTDLRRAFKLDEDVFTGTRTEQVDDNTPLDNVSSNVGLLVKKNRHVARFVVLHRGL
jgi:hypothetical protein